MPELPEVETMRRELEEKVQGRTFLDVWTDAPKLIYYPSRWQVFRKKILGLKIRQVQRRGKVLLIYLSQEKILLVHPKMTGHFLIGRWSEQDKKLSPTLIHQYSIHLVFWLSNHCLLAWSDLRKFSRLELHSLSKKSSFSLIKDIGVDPLSSDFSVKKLQEMIGKSKRPIKVWLMDQSHIGGIGNIYANEILWAAQIHPRRLASSLSLKELETIHHFTRTILREAVRLNGTSVADFRDLENKSGKYASRLRVYRQEGKPCPRCGHLIRRIKLGGRSTYYCPFCQRELL